MVLSNSVWYNAGSEYIDIIENDNLNPVWIKAAQDLIEKEHCAPDYRDKFNQTLIKTLNNHLERLKNKTEPHEIFLRNNYQKVIADIYAGRETELHTLYYSNYTLTNHQQMQHNKDGTKNENYMRSGRYTPCPKDTNKIYDSITIKPVKTYSIGEVGMPLNYC